MKLQHITIKQKEIPKLIYKFRFLDTNHIQTLMSHKLPTRIQTWLKDLKDKGYIGTHFSRKTFDESSKPAVYFLAKGAKQILKDDSDCNPKLLKRVYTEHKREPKFINHCLTVADLYLFFLSQKGTNEVLKFFTQTNLAGYDYFPDPLPDVYISSKSEKGTRRFFLNVFDPYDPYWVPRVKIKEYLVYKESSQWEEETNGAPFPTILFVLPHAKLQKHIYYYAKAKFEKEGSDKISLFLTTMETIRSAKNSADIWQRV